MKKHFLTKEVNSIENTLTQVAKKIYNKIEKTGYNLLLTDRKDYDSLYGYYYDDASCDVLERTIKGFIIYNGGLFACMDVDCIKYDDKALLYSFEDLNDNVWYLIYADNKLVYTENCATQLTLLSIANTIYQYFD